MKKTFLLIVFAVLFFSCKKTPPPANPNTGSTLYISGTVIKPSDGRGLPCYWKDKVRIDLPIPSTAFGSAGSIAQIGNDLYIVGTFNDNGVIKGCYWKNNNLNILPRVSGYSETTAIGIAVNGNDFYIAGTCKSGSNSIPCYWKNGVNPVEVKDAAHPELKGVATGIGFKDNEVYVSGFYIENNNFDKTGFVWKSNLIAILPTVNTGGVVIPNAMIVKNNSIYISGNANGPGNTAMLPLFWDSISTVSKFFGTPVSAVEAATRGNIDVFGNEIYAAGSFQLSGGRATPCYWKNRQFFLLPPIITGFRSTASSVKVYDGNLFICGEARDQNNINQPVYWASFNTTAPSPQKLPVLDDNYGGYTYDIFRGN